jgi:hypothetical protein
MKNLPAKNIGEIERLQNIEERKKYALLIFMFVSFYISVVFAIVILCGTGSLHYSDITLSMLLGTTMVEICL